MTMSTGSREQLPQSGERASRKTASGMTHEISSCHPTTQPLPKIRVFTISLHTLSGAFKIPCIVKKKT